MNVRRALLLSAAAAFYAIAAWTVAPGFFDGFTQAQPYAWLSPPPGVQNGGTPQPGSDQLIAKAEYAGTVFTRDGAPQASISVIPGAFQAPPGGAPITITVAPVSSFPSQSGLRCVTNVYRITSTAPLVKDALVTLRFSDAVPAPSDVYRAPESGGGWTNIGNIGASSPFYISARTTSLGYFAGCYPGDATRTANGIRVGGSQTLPILVALAILLLVLGGIPLALVRRRGDSGSDEEGDGGGGPERGPGQKG